MNQKAIDKMMLRLGRFYLRVVKLPLGEKIARGFARSMARMAFLASPELHRNDTIQGVRDDLVNSCRKMGFKVEVSKMEPPDKFEFFVHECPYGFKDPEHYLACECAMDMDRVMFQLAGGNLVIEESFPRGAKDKCRITMYKI